MRTISIVTALVVAAALGRIEAQSANYRDPRTPRSSDGRPNLSAPAPRLNGKPDLSGVWQPERTPVSEFVRVLGPGLPAIQPDLNDITKHVLNVLWDIPPDEQPLRPEGAAIMEQRQKSGLDFPTAYCQPGSLPASMLILEFKMIQAPRQIVVLPGNGDPARQIYIDTLVVDTTGFKESAWLDGFGHPRSENMHITERYRRRDFGHMDVEMSFDDPKYYTRPFGFKTTATLLPDTDVLEYVCTENKRSYRPSAP